MSVPGAPSSLDLRGPRRWRLVGVVALMVAFSITEGFGILLFAADT